MAESIKTSKSGSVSFVDEKGGCNSSSQTIDTSRTDSTDEHAIATNYRRVPGKIPPAAWLVCFVSISERWAYYSLIAVLQNYIQNSPDDPLHPGALGLGQSKATMLVNIFLILGYTTPMAAGCLADNYLGRYKVILISLIMYTFGVVVLLITSIPAVIHSGGSLPGLLVALLTIGAALGGTKAVIPPLLVEQCEQVPKQVKTTKSGEKVIEDPEITVQRLFDILHWCMNLGAQGRTVASLLEKYVGFWAVNLMALCAILLSLAVFCGSTSRFTLSKPSGSVLGPSFKAFGIAIRNGFKMDAARPETIEPRDGEAVPWSNAFVDDLQMALSTSRALLPFIIFWLCQSQMLTNLISQAATMRSTALPNDLLPTFNAITVLLLLPLTSHYLYPFLRHHTPLTPTPLRRIAFGFTLESLAMTYAAILQSRIYSVGPCYSHPLSCPASNAGSIPNNISIIFQLPVYILEGLAEIFACPAGYEFSFQQAPRSMKSVLQGMYELAAATGSALSVALTPLNRDPDVLGVYAGVAGAMAVGAVVVGVVGRREGRRRKVVEEEEGEEER